MVAEIVSQLAVGTAAIVRTDYLLTDAEFYSIGATVVEQTGNYELGGFYWLGLIVLTSDPSLLL